MINSEIAAMGLGEDLVIAGEARIIVQPRELGNERLFRYQIDGVIISDKPLPDLDDTYNMIECDMIIIPRRLNKGFILKDAGGLRIDQMLVRGYGHTENWRQNIVLNAPK